MHVDVSLQRSNAEIQSILNTNTIKFSIKFHWGFNNFVQSPADFNLQFDLVLGCGLKVYLIILILKSVRLSIFNWPELLVHCSHGNRSRKLNSQVSVYIVTSTLLLPMLCISALTYIHCKKLAVTEILSTF